MSGIALSVLGGASLALIAWGCFGWHLNNVRWWIFVIGMHLFVAGLTL